MQSLRAAPAEQHDCKIAFSFTGGGFNFLKHCAADGCFRIKHLVIQPVRRKRGRLDSIIAARAAKPDVFAGDATLESLKLADRANDSVEEVSAAALFIMIGGEPHTTWLPDEIARDAQGYVITGRDLLEQPGEYWTYDRGPLTLETSMPGVFAAGDVRRGSIKRVALAVGEGGAAVRLVHEYLSAHEPDRAANELALPR